jgi:putative spermidine/putrescine transport system permease protein
LRKRNFGKKLLGSLVKIPLFVPALVAAFLVMNLISYHGMVNSFLLTLGIVKEPIRMLNDEFGWGVFLIEIWKNIPFQLLIISSSLAHIQNDIEDAALNLGAGRFKVIFYITLPLSIPGILVAVVLVFIMTFGDFAITKIAGAVYPNSMSVRMFIEAMVFQEWNKAAVMGVVIMITAMIFVAFYTQIGRKIQELRR